MKLIFLALAPVLIIAFYIYFRDKYEKEPIGLLLRSLLIGIVITFPVILVETFFENFTDSIHGIVYAAYRAFITAAFTEEFFKYIAFLLIIWRSRHFNEKFDGIVYAVFISLGFAAVENIFYVLEHGYKIGLVRAITAVPAHALFGIVMGYRFGLARFYPEERKKQLFLAFFLPFSLHGLYDFFLMAEKPLFLVLFVPYIVYLWSHGFRRMKSLSDRSIFKPAEEERSDN